MSELRYYEKRIKELKDLLAKSESKTSKALIEEALLLTETSYTECKRVAKIAMERIRFYDEVMDKWNKGLEVMKEGQARIKASASNEMFSEDTKIKIAAAADGMEADISFQYERRKLANRSVRGAIEFCNEELSKTLLELVYKPNPASFIFDSIVAIFTKIVEGWIPYSDKAEIVLELSISKRKRDYLSSGDKILSYLEDYNSVLRTWIALHKQFEDDVLQKD